MKRTIIAFCLILAGASSGALEARVRVVAAYPWIADIVKKVGGDRVEVSSLSPGNWDPHQVVPKPSLIARMRGARLLVINGADLEKAWLAPLLDESNNGAVRQGSAGYLDLSEKVRLLDAPKNLSRALGDVHPEGNPHFHLDPENVPVIVKALGERLAALDPGGAPHYRGRVDEFNAAWAGHMARWAAKMAPARGSRVVQHHALFNYFLRRYGIETAATIERHPGIPPTARHVAGVIETMKTEKITRLLAPVYASGGPARHVARKAGATLLVLPHDVNAVRGATDIVALFDEIVKALGND